MFEQSNNLPAVPPTNVTNVREKRPSPILFSSGAYSIHIKKPTIFVQPSTSTMSPERPRPSPSPSPKKDFCVLIIALLIAVVSFVLLVSIRIALVAVRRYCGAKVVQAQNASLLHRLSKVFVTGLYLFGHIMHYVHFILGKFVTNHFKKFKLITNHLI